MGERLCFPWRRRAQLLQEEWGRRTSAGHAARCASEPARDGCAALSLETQLRRSGSLASTKCGITATTSPCSKNAGKSHKKGNNMLKGVNKVTLLGHVGKDPEIRATQGGTTAANFSLATSERHREGEEWVDHAEWHNLIAFQRITE